MTNTVVVRDKQVLTESWNKILDDFRISRLTEDFHVSRLEKIKYLSFIFQL